MFRIGKNFAVPHASVILKNPVRSLNNSPLEPSNPFFAEMMQSLHTFVDCHAATITNSHLFTVTTQQEKKIVQTQCQEILKTFGSYIHNFNSLEPTNVVNFFHLPAMLMTSVQVAPMQNSDDVLEVFAMLMKSLKAKKFKDSKIIGSLKATQLSDNQGMVEGVAKRFDEVDKEIEHFGFTYTLRKIETEWKIIVGVIHEPKSYILST